MARHKKGKKKGGIHAHLKGMKKAGRKASRRGKRGKKG
jgi:hypothetical protein